MTSITGVATSFIDFTRASNATVTDSDGKVKWAPHNLLLASEQFDSASWTKLNTTVTPNAATAPDGTTTADQVTSTNTTAHIRQHTATITAGSICTCSVALKRLDNDWVRVQYTDGATNTFWTHINLATGVLGTFGSAGTVSNTAVSVSNLGIGWYLVTLTGTLGTSTNGGLLVYAVNADAGTGVSAKSYYIWGAHLYRSDLGGMQANTSAYPMYNPTTPKNLLGYTEDFSNAAWAKAGATVTSNSALSPNGLQTADTIVESAGGTQHVVTYNTNFTGVLTFSVSVKAAGRNYCCIVDGNSGVLGRFVVDLTNGTVTQNTSSLPYVITPQANGFYRISITGSFNTSQIRVGPNDTGTIASNYFNSYTGDGTSGIYIWGAQLSDSASLDSYVPVYGAAVTSAAYYGPRRDFDPVSLACKGLLVEEQRTNLLLYSADFTQAAWTKFNLNTSGTPAWSNVAVAPDGTQTAEKLIANTTNSAHWVGGSATITSGVAYTVSAYVKSGADVGDYTFASLYDCNASTYIIVNLSTGALVSATAATYTITAVGNGWYRLSVTATSSSTTGYNRVYLYDGTTTNFAGNDAKGIYAWGLQLEAGSFPTSYIPTGAASATRNGDVASVSTQAFPYSATEGTLVVSADTYDVNTASGVMLAAISSGTASNSVNVGVYLSKTTLSSTVGGVAQAFLQPSGTISANTVFKAGGAFATNSFIASSNGTLSTEDTVGTLPVGPTTLGIGIIATSLPVNGHIRQITYLPRRISNTELVTRTSA